MAAESLVDVFLVATAAFPVVTGADVGHADGRAVRPRQCVREAFRGRARQTSGLQLDEGDLVLVPEHQVERSLRRRRSEDGVAEGPQVSPCFPLVGTALRG